MSNVKLSIIVKKRPIDVHLNNVSTFLLLSSISIFFSLALLQQRVQLIDFINYSYSSTLVTVFSRFNNPDISHFVLCSSFLFLSALVLLY